MVLAADEHIEQSFLDETTGLSPRQFYEDLSQRLTEAHGSLVRVDYTEHYPRFAICFLYDDGHRVHSGARTGRIDIHRLALGYVGHGPEWAHCFIRAAGLDISYEDIATIRPGDSIEFKEGRTLLVRKEDKVTKDQEGLVQFSEEINKYGGIYRLYTAPTEEAAKDFLRQQEVASQGFFIIVKTPDDAFAKDRCGDFDPTGLLANLQRN
ncbi:MAG: hypothetical protein FJ280_22430 [Planctomycetes bacterium]|nr:hypothetical protein [Planctomycetota bacterium]